MAKVTIQPSTTYDVHFPDGSVLNMTQTDSWEGMAMLRCDEGDLIVSYCPVAEAIGVVGVGADASVVKASPSLLERMNPPS